MYGGSYSHRDPVLMRLTSATVNALSKANIKCLEDLFSLKEPEILNIPGIGKKRSKAILDLLYRLPFDYRDDSLPGNPQQDPYAGVHPVLKTYLTQFWYVGEKFYTRGVDYFQRGMVGQFQLQDEATQSYTTKVIGTRQYTVTLNLEASDRMQAHCTCPAFAQWGYGAAACKHVVAAALALAEQQRLMRFGQAEDGNRSYRLLLHSLATAKSNANTHASQPLEYLLVQKQGQWELYPRRIYPVAQQSSRYGGRNNPWDELIPADPRDRMIVSYLREVHTPSYYYYYSRKQATSFGDALELLRDRPVYLKRGGEPATEVRFQEAPFTPQLEIGNSGKQNPSNDGEGQPDLMLEFRLQSEKVSKNFNEVEVLSVDPCWVVYGTTLARVAGSDLAQKFFLNVARETVRIPANEIESFLQDIYPTLQDAEIPIRIGDEVTEEKAVDPVPRLYLRERADRLWVELRIAYHDYEVRVEDRRTQILLPNREFAGENDPPIWSVTRDTAREERWVEELQKTGLESTGSFRTFTPTEAPLEWVAGALPALAGAGYEIYGQQQLKRYAPPKKLTASTLTVRSGEQWFEVEGTMSFGDLAIDMSDIRRVLIRDKPYVRLRDGSTGELPEDWLERLQRLLHLLPTGQQQARIPKIAASAIEEIGEAVDDYRADTAFQQYVDRLREFHEVKPVEPPDEFRGTLRPYQVAGLSWLRFLHQYGFGGILADDMGLGKTIQVLALLQKIREESGTEPITLVIAPRSVIHNWETEAGRFLPDCPVYIHHGTDRAESSDAWPEATLNITTYSTMRNDISVLGERAFDYIILDESHTIRNPSSKTFRAIRRLQGEHRLCLTGTPVQNTTMDLWSQFEFLNPGILGGQKRFSEEWVKPLEQENDRTVEEMLHKMVAPFILRRTKQQVARDLPSLTASQVECTMDATQQRIYEKYRQVYHRIVNEAIDAKGVRDSSFTVLEGLTRLRQICCSPRLIDGETGSSAKLQRFVDLAEELICEGHRALVFSQFVRFLRHIEAEVQRRGWKYEYLDGQTRNRQERVDRFQTDASKSLFLISLKAGGEGLNLTGADYVFLMDPWWNPAAERQAMDRTHRIGQDEHVFVYRFVCPGTVEGKILRLQERKRDLAEKLVVAEPGIFKQLKREDLLALFE